MLTDAPFGTLLGVEADAVGADRVPFSPGRTAAAHTWYDNGIDS